MPRLKVLTLNLWGFHGNWEARRDRLVTLMQAEELDVLLLQEVADRGWRLNQAVELASMTGYAMMYAPSQTYLYWPAVATGLAVLSRFPLANAFSQELVASQGPFPVGIHERRIAQRVELSLDNMSVVVYNTHFPLRPYDRVLAARKLWELIAQDEAVLVVVGGDFNAPPDETPIRFLQGQEFLDGRLGQLADAWNTAGIGPAETYSSSAPHRRIDYIFYQSEPSIIVQEARVVGLRPQELSDHAGVVATFSVSPTREPSTPFVAEPVATLTPA